jgi:hypothetical protein
MNVSLELSHITWPQGSVWVYVDPQNILVCEEPIHNTYTSNSDSLGLCLM